MHSSLIISTGKNKNFLASQLTGKLTGAAVTAGEQKNGLDDKAIPAQAAAEVLRSIVKVL